jgi:predicted Ser/Thr protein kinase
VIDERFANYRILRPLGEGGMGVVYLAEHEILRRPAAIKLLHAELSRSPDLVQRFMAEARATAAIKHPGIVEVLDCGVHESGKAYIVMELLEGSSLGRVLQQRGVMEPDEIVVVGRQLAAAVGAAHEHGLVHRDLKPENVFLVGGRIDQVKVLDFGIAKLMGDSPGSPRTRTGTVLGTPAYMSPEQCRGTGEIDHRSDLYSLGCVLYEMACGRLPFAYAGTGELMAAHLKEPPPPPRSWNAAVPPALEALVLRLLSKAPDDRPRSMAALFDELSALGSSPLAGRTQRLEPPGATMKLEPAPPGATMKLEPAPLPVEEPRSPDTTLGAAAAAMEPARPRASRGNLAMLPLRIIGPAIGVIMFVRAFGGPVRDHLIGLFRPASVTAPASAPTVPGEPPKPARPRRSAGAPPFAHHPAHLGSLAGAANDGTSRWLDGLVDCLDGVSLTAQASFERYRAWVKDLDAGPTGKEAAAGLHRLGPLTSCSARLRAPAVAVGGDLVDAAAAYERAMRALDRAIDDAAAHYESGKRNVTVERRLHRPLMAAFRAFSDADAALRRAVEAHVK